MVNKLRFLGTELKQSYVFIIIITIEILVCICVLNYAFTRLDGSLAERAYYSKSVADFNYVSVLGTIHEDKNTVGELNDILDLSNFAVSLSVGEIWDTKSDTYAFKSIGLISPALKEYFNKNVFKHDLRKFDNYIEAYVGKESGYEIGKLYTIPFLDKAEVMKRITIKPVAVLKTNTIYSLLSGYPYSSNYMPHQVVICDDIINYSNSKVNGGVFCENKPSSYYENLGLSAESVEEMYQNAKEADKEGITFLFYAAGVAMFFTFLSIVCLYMINFHETARKRTINYICGLSRGMQLLYETIKMLLIITVAFVIDFVGTFIIYDPTSHLILQTPKNAIIASGVVLVMYTAALILGIIKHTKANIVNDINNEH